MAHRVLARVNEGIGQRHRMTGAAPAVEHLGAQQLSCPTGRLGGDDPLDAVASLQADDPVGATAGNQGLCQRLPIGLLEHHGVAPARRSDAEVAADDGQRHDRCVEGATRRRCPSRTAARGAAVHAGPVGDAPTWLSAGASAITASMNAWTPEIGVGGRTPWPRLKTWPAWPPTAA